MQDNVLPWPRRRWSSHRCCADSNSNCHQRHRNRDLLLNLHWDQQLEFICLYLVAENTLSPHVLFKDS